MKIATTILAGIIGLSMNPTQCTSMEQQKSIELHTSAESAALMDVTSGRILYSKQGDSPRRIASLTKIMTAIIAIEHGHLHKKVTVSRHAFGKEGSSLYLKLGETMTLENMLYGLMLRSGNDAATAIAEHIGGSEDGFVYLMNEKAMKLGLKNTQFKNPHGLDEEGHYSSANDLAKLCTYALHNPTFQNIVKTKIKRVRSADGAVAYVWRNKNKMLRLYQGADGIKTGFTKKALRCLASSATRNGQQLVAITLKDSDDWNDHKNMLNYGFKHYPLVSIAQKKQAIEGQNLMTGSAFVYPLHANEKEQLYKKLVLFEKQNKNNSVHFGLVGKIQVFIKEVLIGEISVYEKGALLPNVPQKTREAFKQFLRHGAGHFNTCFKYVCSCMFARGGERSD